MTVEAVSLLIETMVALGTLALAFVTWRLAVQTKALAQEGLDAAAASERQHRQQLMPLCKFSQNTFSVVSVNADGREVARIESPGMIRNAGAGPAFNVTVSARIPSEKYGTIWAKIGPVGPGEELPPLDALHTKFDFSEAAQEARIEIEYADLFNQRYQTVYMHDPNMVYVRGPEPPLTGKGSDMLFPPDGYSIIA